MVPRPSGAGSVSFDHLHGELQRFADTLTGSPARLTRLLLLSAPGAGERGAGGLGADARAAAVEEERHVQEVAAQMCARLESDWGSGFRDVTVPFAVGVYELRLGLRLASSSCLLAAQAAAAAAAAAASGGGAEVVAVLMRVPFAYASAVGHSSSSSSATAPVPFACGGGGDGQVLLEYARRLAGEVGESVDEVGSDGRGDEVEKKAGGGVEGSECGEGVEGEKDMAVLRAGLHAVCVAVAQSGRWSEQGAAALEVLPSVGDLCMRS